MSVPDTSIARLSGNVIAPPGSNIALAEWVADAHDGGEPRWQAPLHRHEDDEAWYVLEGSLTVRIGPDDVVVPAGGAAVVPGGTPHTYWNANPEPARYLLVMGARTYALIEAIHATPDRSPERMRQLFSEHGAELLES